MKIYLPARLPFSFYSVVRSHGWWQLAPFRFDEPGGMLAYTGRLNSGRVVDLQLRAAGEGVEVEVDGEMRPEEEQEVGAMVSWMLGLEQDFSAFYALARNEPKLHKAVETAGGRVLRCPTLFEDVIKTILTTNTLWNGTKRMVQNLVDLYGEALPGDGTRRGFPTAQRLAAVSEAELRQEARLGYRAPYVLKLAQQAASGEVDLEGLKRAALATGELRKQLLALKGIGGYAAANLLMILGRYDEIPVDSWALKAVSHEWYAGKAIGPGEVQAAFEGWGEWKGLAFWFWEWSLTSQA
jgi:3-methyladenine DNA glycosylase/8-oxoguanine DNA glycosylase